MFWKNKKKKEYKPNIEGMEQPKSLGFLNPLWRIKAFHNGQELISLPLVFMVHTYLKDYGFEPDKKTNPSLIVVIDTGSGEIKMPMFIKNNAGLNGNFTAEVAREKGLIL